MKKSVLFRYTRQWVVTLSICVAPCIANMAWAVTLTLSCGAVGQELTLCRQGAAAWAARSGHEVKVISTPSSATERLALYQQLLAARATDVDVFQIDITWPAILADHLIDLAPYAKGATTAHFPALIRNNIVNNRLVAIPWFMDAGLLYYRKDLLSKYNVNVPQTWQQLSESAWRIQQAERRSGASGMWGFVWQGRAYEGLTCNALEWVASHNGGTIVNAQNKPTINNPNAIAALTQAASWVKRITPEGVLNYAEEESRGIFQSGHAVFMRNWPYAWSLMQSNDSIVRGKIGVAALPKGGEQGRHSATLGGWQLAISKYAAHPDIAADLVLFLTSAVEQKRRAVTASFNPTLPALYRDREILAANPFLEALYETFASAEPRPSAPTGAHYNQVSSEFWNAVHAVLAGRIDAAASVRHLESRLRRILR